MGTKMHEISLSTSKKNEFVNITDDVKKIVELSKAKRGICVVYASHSSGAITINENTDPNIPLDIMGALNKIIPERDNYGHDKIDDNAAAHIKATLIGPSQSIPIIDGELVLGSWQDIFFCEFDGPRKGRTIIVQIVESKP